MDGARILVARSGHGMPCPDGRGEYTVALIAVLAPLRCVLRWHRQECLCYSKARTRWQAKIG